MLVSILLKEITDPQTRLPSAYDHCIQYGHETSPCLYRCINLPSRNIMISYSCNRIPLIEKNCKQARSELHGARGDRHPRVHIRESSHYKSSHSQCVGTVIYSQKQSRGTMGNQNRIPIMKLFPAGKSTS